jgi:hypothetical protein
MVHLPGLRIVTGPWDALEWSTHPGRMNAPGYSFSVLRTRLPDRIVEVLQGERIAHPWGDYAPYRDTYGVSPDNERTLFAAWWWLMRWPG